MNAVMGACLINTFPLLVVVVAVVGAIASNMLSLTARRTLNLRTLSRIPTRSYASVTSSSPNPNTVGPFQVFDRNAKRMQKDAAVAKDNGETSRVVDYVRDEVADRMMERLQVSPVMFAISVYRGELVDLYRTSKESLIPY